jgi:hypothetical protein
MRYALLFTLSILCLTAATIATFRRLAIGNAVPLATVATQPVADTLPTPEVETPPMPTAADYARYAAADRVWRQHFAKPYTVADLRELDPNKRSPRDELQDRVFKLVSANQQRQAITELERWVRAHPTDAEMLLALARLLSEAGRPDDAVGRYRQILALHRGEE